MRTDRLRRIGDVAPAVYLVENTEKKDDIRILLRQIHGFYEAALDQLPARKIPALGPCLLTAGVCFGVLDPVSNIIANTIAYSLSSNHKDEEGKGKEEEPIQLRTREKVMSRIITDTNDNDVFRLPLSSDTAERMTVARRSLEGLVSFLSFYFRYLPGTEALRYLRLAGADLLAAVRLIERDRNNSVGKFGFSVVSISTKVAMGCAAASAKHPSLGTLIRTSQLLANRLEEASISLPHVIDNGSGLSPNTNLRRLRRLLNKQEEPNNAELTDPCYSRPLQLAAWRYEDAVKRREEELPSREHTKQRQRKRKAKKLHPGDTAECTEQRRKKRKGKKLPSADSTKTTHEL